MAKRKLTPAERAYYDEPYAWHLRGQHPPVYHVAPNCPAGTDLDTYLMADFLDGTGGYPKCPQCAALGE